MTTPEDILAASPASDWQALDPAETLYLDIDARRIVIQLATDFAPAHVANIKALVRRGYFDGMPITRVQDNFVVQWGILHETRDIGDAQRKLPPEFDQPLKETTPFTLLSDCDGYAPKVGFVRGMPVACDPLAARMWLTHGYGMVGVGRDDAADSGSGTVLYTVIGHAPRYLDRNTTLVGRVVHGLEWLSALPRGRFALHQNCAVIDAITLAADLPEPQRLYLEMLRTESQTFQAFVAAWRNRRDAWFKFQAGYIDLGSVPLSVRSRRL